jgi:ribonuclease BN (tRNA processing enzyme)
MHSTLKVTGKAPWRQLPGLAACLLLGLLGAENASAQGAAPPAPSAMELIVLGSGGPRAEGRAASAYVLLLDAKARAHVEVGPGAFVRAGEMKLNQNDIDLVFLTHFHIDHVADLPAIVKYRTLIREGTTVFSVFGPVGDKVYPGAGQFIDRLFGAGGVFEYQPTFGSAEKFQVKDLPAGLAAGLTEIHAAGGLRVFAIGTAHGPAPSVAYRFDYRGRSIVFSGDTNETAADNLVTLAKDADLLVYNCVILDNAGARLLSLHTRPRVIGEIAQRAGVKRLLLSHIQPNIDQAKDEVLRSVSAGYPGPVSLAEDKLRLGFPAR